MCWGPPQVLDCSFIAEFMLGWPTDCKPIKSLIVMPNHAVQGVRGFKTLFTYLQLQSAGRGCAGLKCTSHK